MAVFLFWNVGKKALRREIAAACREHHVDVIILAESEVPSRDLLLELNSASSGPTFFEPPNMSDWLKFYTRYPPTSFESAFDDNRVAIRRLRPPVGQEVLIAAAHLPSKLHQESADQAFQARSLAAVLVEQETRFGHQSSIIIGDLNMNPFDEPIVAADGLHGVMEKRIALRRERTVQKHPWSFFYNPMWNHMGDEREGPCGTCYFPGSNMVEYFWKTFDQVLLRPDLIQFCDPGYLKVLHQIDGVDLLRDGRLSPQFSDHLPLVLRLELERKV